MGRRNPSLPQRGRCAPEQQSPKVVQPDQQAFLSVMKGLESAPFWALLSC